MIAGARELWARRPVSGASLAAFRIAFGALGLAATVRFAANGWIADLYTEPERHFSYAGFWWAQPWPGWGMQAHFAALAAASAGVALGFKYRLSIIAFFLLFTYARADRQDGVSEPLLPSQPAEPADDIPADEPRGVFGFVSGVSAAAAREQTRSAAARRGDRPRVDGLDAPGASRRGYLFGGIAKLNADWLLSAQPLRVWLLNGSDAPLVWNLLAQTWFAYAMSWGGAAFDLAIVGALLWRRSRPWAYGALVAFHVATWLLFPRIGMFPWIMICAAAIFFPPDWPRDAMRRARRLLGLRESEGERETVGEGAGEIPSPRDAPGGKAIRRLGFAALAVFAAVQIAVPMRHLAYPGDVLWNEDGYRFSWRVMLAEKSGYARFRVTDRATGEEWFAYPEDYLTPLQAERMPYSRT